MNNLEKKQERLKRLEEQRINAKEKLERLNQEIKQLTKAIEMESMADVFQEGKVNRMTVSDWMQVRDSIATGALQEFLKEKYGGDGKEEKKQGSEEEYRNNENE